MIFILSIALVALLLFLLFKIMDRETQEMNEEARKDAPGSFVTLSLGVTHYEIRGGNNKKPLVLIHGISLPSYSWSTFADEVAKRGFRVITYDLFGRGYSDRPDTIYDSDLYVTQLSDLLKALHCTEKISVLGISMGGGIANHFASQYPERVEKVVLMTPLHSSNLAATIITTPPLGELLMTLLAAKKMISIQQNIEKEFHLMGEWSDLYEKQMNFFGYRRAIISSVRHFATENHLAAFQKLSKTGLPTLLIWGKNDMVIPFAGHKFVQAALPNATFLPLENVGHLIPVEKPTISDDVVAFLDA